MATNLHKNLPDSQIHSPKGFIGASGSSVCGKNESNELEWFNSNYSLTVTITCLDDVSGITGGRNFNLFTKTTNYQVWLDVDNTDSFVVDSGYTGVEVDISAGDNATTIATALKVALNALTGISAGSAGAVVTVTIDSSIADKKQATDGVVGKNTGWKFVTTKNDVGNEYLTTDGSGNIEWIPKPALKSLHQFSAVVAPKSSTFYNKYHSDGTQGHDNKILTVNTGVTTMPTTVSSFKAPLESVMFLPANVMSYKIRYTVYHNDAGTQNVNFKFAETKLITGVDTSQSLVTVATIADSVPSGETVTKDVSCTSSISDNKALILYGAGPTNRSYYIYGMIELTIT